MLATSSKKVRVTPGKVFHDISLKQFNCWRVGGNAKTLYMPTNIEDLQNFLARIDNNEQIIWIGLGSNLLIRDNGVAGTVIITHPALTDMQQISETKVQALSGTTCAAFARFSVKHNLTGGEFFAGIPGTIGGALAMNAGAFKGETWDAVTTVTTIDRQGKLHIRHPEDFNIAYRHVSSKNHNQQEWFVSATFDFKVADKQQNGLEKIKTLLQTRALSQPIGKPSCGSVFKNPEGDYAARLIEQAGLKGCAIGNARVSKKHANFIINEGGATASDIEILMMTVQKIVYEKFEIKLIPEVCVIGE
ncbi:MAG: UDP-N-acetylenolpyruvoylglucosamine reductase [Thiotrichales bacterium]|nr:MAG: UDP-N-acetylenolpyruvoylglucosamine reductase [Thiotrichales bacterium]